jgi:hypothetical protein
VTAPLSGCQANFLQTADARASTAAKELNAELEAQAESGDFEKFDVEKWEPPSAPDAQPDKPGGGDDAQGGGDIFGLGDSFQSQTGSGQTQSPQATMRGADELYRFLLEPGE